MHAKSFWVDSDLGSRESHLEHFFRWTKVHNTGDQPPAIGEAASLSTQTTTKGLPQRSEDTWTSVTIVSPALQVRNLAPNTKEISWILGCVVLFAAVIERNFRMLCASSEEKAGEISRQGGRQEAPDVERGG